MIECSLSEAKTDDDIEDVIPLINLLSSSVNSEPASSLAKDVKRINNSNGQYSAIAFIKFNTGWSLKRSKEWFANNIE
jgi:hypothetical protein